MDWIVFGYSLPTKSSSPRVTLWRRLRRLGAISPAGGLYVLPANAECIEAFNWLAQEIRQAKGEAVVLRVAQFEGLADAQLVALFNAARQAEYAELDKQIDPLTKPKSPDRAQWQDALEKLRKQHADIARVDYFNCPSGTRIAARLDALAATLAPPARGLAAAVPSARVADYRAKTWVTRPGPFVDRIACAWLIRRFINPRAIIRYALVPQPHQVAFDMDEGEFGHRGNLCTFETMCQAFGFNDAGLRALAEIVHAIDLRDARYAHPATAGVETIFEGWQRANLPDDKLELYGIALFDGLYQNLVRGADKKSPPRQTKRKGVAR
jgi:hypothetical protein